MEAAPRTDSKTWGERIAYTVAKGVSYLPELSVTASLREANMQSGSHLDRAVYYTALTSHLLKTPNTPTEQNVSNMVHAWSSVLQDTKGYLSTNPLVKIGAWSLIAASLITSPTPFVASTLASLLIFSNSTQGSRNLQSSIFTSIQKHPSLYGLGAAMVATGLLTCSGKGLLIGPTYLGVRLSTSLITGSGVGLWLSAHNVLGKDETGVVQQPTSGLYDFNKR